MYEATVCILQAVAFFAISLYKRLADFLLAGEGQPITKEISASVRQLGAVSRTAGEHFQTVTDGGQHRLQILLSRLGGAGEV